MVVLQAELAAQRNLVLDLPQLWQLAKVISLQGEAERKPREAIMRHQATISRQGTAPVFSMPHPVTPIPLDQPCMPSLLSTHRVDNIGNAEPRPPPNAASTADHPDMPTSDLPPTTTTAQTDAGSAHMPHSDQPATQQSTEAGDASNRPYNQPSAGRNSQQAPHASSHVPLHQDHVCQSHIACQEAALIMSEGAYECLTATWAPSYRGGWELPVTIRAKPHTGQSQGFTQPQEQLEQQVIIDSPLPKRMLNLREKHEMLYRHAVRKLGCDLPLSRQAEQAAAQAAAGADPNAHDASDQQHEQWQHQQWQQQTEAEMFRPYSPSNDVPYSPSNDSLLDDQNSVYGMPMSISPTAADLHSASLDTAPYPQMQEDDADAADQDMDMGGNSDDGEASVVGYFAAADGQDAAEHDAGSLQAQLDASVAAAGATAAAAADTLADAPATGVADTGSAAPGTTADADATAAEADTTAAADGDGGGATAGPGSGTAGTSSEAIKAGTGYDTWQLGPYKMVIRSQLPLHVVHALPPQARITFINVNAACISATICACSCKFAHGHSVAFSPSAYSGTVYSVLCCILLCMLWCIQCFTQLYTLLCGIQTVPCQHVHKLCDDGSQLHNPVGCWCVKNVQVLYKCTIIARFIVLGCVVCRRAKGRPSMPPCRCICATG